MVDWVSMASKGEKYPFEVYMLAMDLSVEDSKVSCGCMLFFKVPEAIRKWIGNPAFGVAVLSAIWDTRVSSCIG